MTFGVLSQRAARRYAYCRSDQTIAQTGNAAQWHAAKRYDLTDVACRQGRLDPNDLNGSEDAAERSGRLPERTAPLLTSAETSGWRYPKGALGPFCDDFAGSTTAQTGSRFNRPCPTVSVVGVGSMNGE